MREENTARRVVANVPPCLVTKENGSYYAAILGDTKTGKEILHALITMGQFEPGNFQADLLTDQKQEEALLTNVEGCPFLSITLKRHYLLGKEEKLLRYLEEKGKQLQQIYVCTENKKEDERLENLLYKMLGQTGIHRRIQIINVSSSYWKTQGLLCECEEDIIERMGQEIFFDYAKSHQLEPCWEKLTEFERNANYNSAMHIPSKLYLAGVRIQKEYSGEQQAFETKEQFLAYLTEERITLLTRLEHLRWCAFYVISGYRCLSASEADMLHDKENRRHACLVPWEELPRISVQYACDFIKKDRDRVIHMFDYVKNSGHVIEKITPELLSEHLRKPSVSVYPSK